MLSVSIFIFQGADRSEATEGHKTRADPMGGEEAHTTSLTSSASSGWSELVMLNNLSILLCRSVAHPDPTKVESSLHR